MNKYAGYVGSRYNRVGGAVGIVTAAVRGALQSRRKYKNYLKSLTLKKSIVKTKPRYKKKPRTTGRTIVLTRRRKTFRENHSIENSTRSLQVRARQPSVMKLFKATLEPQWLRIQGMTQYDETNGYFTISNRLDTSTGFHLLPMHVWDLTCQTNQNAGATITPSAGYGTYFISTAAGANASTYVLRTQDANGTTFSTSPWLDENTSSSLISETSPLRKCMHHYTHIKMNLYGVRKRATRYLVQLVMVKQDYGDFLSANDANTEKKKIFDYLMRPFIYNNLNSGDPQIAKDIKILKTYETWVAPIQTTEYDGSSATPHIQTLNWFVRHERIREYDWQRGDTPANTQTANYDLDDGDLQGRVDPKKRVYLLVRALCPSRRDIVGNSQDIPPDVITEPSYDLVMRNKFSHPL